MVVLEYFRKQAKIWLKDVRRRDPGALERLRLAYPKAPADPVLRDVQHALACELGCQSWQALKAALDRDEFPGVPAGLQPRAHETHAGRVAMFLQFACWSPLVPAGGDHARMALYAARLLRKHPEIAADSIYTAIVCGNVADVERRLASRPALVNEKGGSRNWEPLLYLCYGRLPLDAARDNAVAMARLLLGRGADPKAHDMVLTGTPLPGGERARVRVPYGTLVGVAGEGEQGAPPHPDRDVLYLLLLEAGAGPYDIQVLYHTHVSGDLLWWLRITCDHAARIGRADDWRNPAWPMFDMGVYGSGARFVLDTAIDSNRIDLAEWTLAHGANPNAPPPSAAPTRAPDRIPTSLYDRAVRENRPAIAELLGRYGADQATAPLEGEEAFVAACLRLDRATAERLASQHPEYLQSPRAMFAAAARNETDVMRLLLDLGTPIDVTDAQRQRPLHVAVADDARHAAAFLVARGADIDAPENSWHASPLAYASHHGRAEIIDLLSASSLDVCQLAANGKVDRLRAVLAGNPTLAGAASASGFPPLWWLPDDEADAAELLLAHGADPAAGPTTRTTAAMSARQRGLDEAANLIEAAAARRA